MLKKITEIFTEEEIVEAILRSGDEKKVASLIADEEFFKKYIALMLKYEIGLDKIREVIQNTTAPEVLHTIAVAIIEQDYDAELLEEIFNNPYCSGETIVMAEEEFSQWWTECTAFRGVKEPLPEYSKEKLWAIARADKKGICSIGIIEFPNCDEELLYKILENCRNNTDYYISICDIALKREYILRQDILEEILDNFLDDYLCKEIDDFVMHCNEAYLERVIAKIEETASDDVREKARAAYAERKKGSK